MPFEEVLLYKPDSSLLSMGGAIENITLSATALGYGTCWLCAPIIAYKGFKKILNLSETDKIVSLLTIGKPENNNTQQPPKKSLEEVIEIIE
jgi:nitroreductase